jgi:hypothetical protein
MKLAVISDKESIETTLPHALGQEKSVLSTLLQHPAKIEERHGLTADSFYLPAHKTIFVTIADIAKTKTVENVELVGLVQRFIDDGNLDNIGGAAALTELFNYAPNTAYFAAHCQTLHEKHSERLLVLAGIAAQQGDAQKHSELIRERDIVNQLATQRSTLMERLEALRYSPTADPPVDEVCMSLRGRAIASRGNLTAIQAKQKAGKTAVISAILGATIRGTHAADGDLLGFEWEGDSNGSILHFDTEQSRADWHSGLQRAEARSGLAPTDRLHSYSIVTFTLSERMEILRRKMAELSEAGGIDTVVLDGGADFLASVNDEEQSTELVRELMSLAQQYHCPIIIVIHENPGTAEGKTRGHFGSELQRKAFANIRIDKDSATGISTLYGTDIRKGDIPKSHGICFGWSDTAGMHITLGNHGELAAQTKDAERSRKEREKWTEVFNYESEKRDKTACPDLSPKQAAEIIRDINGTEKAPTESTVKKQMQRAEMLGVLRKTNRGTWTLQ